MGLKDPIMQSAKSRRYLLFCPRARGNGSRLLAVVRAWSCNSIQAAPGAELVCSCQSSRCSRYLVAKSLFPVGGWSHGHLCPGPVAVASQRPTDNCSSVWQPLLCLFMVLFSLINLKLVTYSSSLGCQGDACPCVTSGEYFSGQLCLVPALAIHPSQAVAASRSSGRIGSAWAG